jgi:hypothetical protein
MMSHHVSKTNSKFTRFDRRGHHIFIIGGFVGGQKKGSVPINVIKESNG